MIYWGGEVSDWVKLGSVRTLPKEGNLQLSKQTWLAYAGYAASRRLCWPLLSSLSTTSPWTPWISSRETLEANSKSGLLQVGVFADLGSIHKGLHCLEQSELVSEKAGNQLEFGSAAIQGLCWSLLNSRRTALPRTIGINSREVWKPTRVFWIWRFESSAEVARKCQISKQHQSHRVNVAAGQDKCFPFEGGRRKE